MHNWAMSRLVCFVTAAVVFFVLHANGRFLNSTAEWQQKEAGAPVHKVHFVFRFAGDSVWWCW